MVASKGAYTLTGELVLSQDNVATKLYPDREVLREISIIAKSANSSPVYIGGDSVDETVNDGLPAGASVVILLAIGFDISEIYISGDTDDGVNFYGTLV